MKRCLAICLTLFSLACGGAEHTDQLDGWYRSGSFKAAYAIGVDHEKSVSGSSAYLTAQIDPGDHFGTLMQMAAADEYRGGRLRLRGWVASSGLDGWAGLWMRVDSGATQIDLDNMSERPITGSTRFTQYDVVLDVPERATAVAFGVLLAGSGAVWLDSVELELVDMDVAVTSKNRPAFESARNLGFEGH